MKLLLVVALTCAATVARADAFSDGLKDYTGEYNAAFTLSKLTTFKVGKKCLAKLADKNQGALHAASFYARDVAAYAKAVTGEDWSAVEGNDHDANKDKVGAMVEAFKSKFSVTVTVDGDDCDASSNSLWLRYWSGIATSIRNNPPPSGKAFVTLTVTSKQRDVTVDVNKDGTQFVINAPKDIEAPLWSDKLDRPFRKNASGIPEDWVFNVKESTGRYSSAWVLSKLTTFKLGKKCLAKISDKDSEFTHTAGFYTRDILEYVKAVGGDDWDRIEQQSANDPKTNRDLVEKSMTAFKSKLAITVTVEGDDCDAKPNSMWMKVWSQVATSLKNYPPKAGKVTISVTVTPKAKTVSASGNGSAFTVTAPRDVEPPAWTDAIDNAFKKYKR